MNMLQFLIPARTSSYVYSVAKWEKISKLCKSDSNQIFTKCKKGDKNDLV